MARIGLLNYEANNPQRDPQWRYTRARYLADHRPRPLPCVCGDDDVWIRKARSYILHYAAAGKGITNPVRIEAKRKNLYNRFPAFHHAYGLFTAEMIGSNKVLGHQRYALEGRILAGQSNNEISRLMPIMPGTVEYYEKVFFNVRDRLHYKDYIIGQIVTPPNNVGLQEFTLEMSAKFFGYFGGTVVLEFVLNQFDCAQVRPKSSKQIDGFYDSFFQKTIRRRASESSVSVEINRWNVMQLFEIHSMLIAEARLRDRDLGHAGQYEENMRVMLNSIPWTTGRDSRKALGDSAVGEYLKGPYELRASELAGFTNGPPPVALLEQVKRPLQRQAEKREASHDDEEAL